MKLETIREWLLFFAEPQVYGPLMGIIVAIGGTQYAKNWLPESLTDFRHKRATESIALILGFCTTYSITDDPYIAIAIGFLNPVIYKFSMKAAYKRWPWLEEKVSARPVIKRDAEGNAIGVKVGDEKTEYFRDRPS